MALVVHLPIDRPAEPTIATSSSTASVAYDVAINGMGFVTAISPQTPFARQTAQYRKEQFDAADEAGEQSLDFWWLRSQSSFHGGAGLLYFESPGNDDPISRVRFDSSRNVDVWTPGKVTRLPDTELVVSSGSTCGGLVGARRSTDNYAVVAFGTALKAYKITDAGSTSTITYTWGGSNAIQSLASDGMNYYAAETGGIYSGPIDNSGSGTKLWNSGTLAAVGWVKQRLVAGINNVIYELVGGAPPTLPTAKYTHPNTDWRWTAFAESPTGILAAGYSGDESAIFSFELNSSGVVPTLTSGVIAARMPLGERVYAMFPYAGATIGIGTSKGVRVGTFSDAGDLSYGPISVTMDTACHALTGRGDFLYASATAYQDDESGLVRVDLGTEIDQGGHLAYASDILTPDADVGVCSGVSVVAGRLVFAVDGYGLVLEGVGAGDTGDAWLRTSRIRFSTIEPKLFKFGRVRGDFPDELNVHAVTPFAAEAESLALSSSNGDPEEFNLPAGGYEWLQLRFQMLGSADHEFRSYQIKSLPGTKRQRLIQVPLRIGDSERDRHNHVIGGRGHGWSKLQELELLEQAGDVVNYESRLPYATEARLCVIDKITFEQSAQPTQVGGVSGIATVTFRTVD